MEATGEARGKPSMVSVDEALKIVLGVAQRLPPITMPLQDALGKVLAEDVRAPDPLPPYPASIKVTQKPYLFYNILWLF